MINKDSTHVKTSYVKASNRYKGYKDIGVDGVNGKKCC